MTSIPLGGMSTSGHRIMVEIDGKSKGVEKALKKTTEATKKLEKATFTLNRKFNMNALSFIFGGLAMRRAGEGFFRAISRTYMQVANYQSAMSQGIMGLGAGFEFLKFSMFNALNQSELFQNIIRWLTDTINKVSEFVNKNPKVAEWAAIAAGILVAVGAISQFAGFFMQTSQVVGLFKDLAGISWKTLTKAWSVMSGYIDDAAIATNKLAVATWTAYSPILLVSSLLLVLYLWYRLATYLGSFDEVWAAFARGFLRVAMKIAQTILDVILFPLKILAESVIAYYGGIGKTIPSWAFTIRDIADIGKTGMENYLDWEEGAYPMAKPSPQTLEEFKNMIIYGDININLEGEQNLASMTDEITARLQGNQPAPWG